jgi:hypothetical protein
MFPTGLGELRNAVVAAANALEPERMTLEQSVTAVRELNAIANTALAACALVAARIDELGPPPSAGASDTGDFIAKTTGTTATAAKRHIKTGARLHAADTTRARALTGSLSPAQTEAICDAVAVDPAAEDALLDVASRSSLGALREECARRKAAVDPDPGATRRRIHRRRRLRRYEDAEGASHLHAVGTRDDMARFDVALRAHIDAIFKAARANGVRDPYDAHAFDALIAMADNAITDDTSTTTPHAGGAKPKARTRFLGIVRVDLEALLRGSVEGDETCEIGGLGPIPVTTARDLLGDSILKLVITRGVDVRNVTHLGRTATAAQRIALLWERRRCLREGCGRHERLEIDHRDDYARVHKTELANLDPLCHRDHWLKTHRGWALIDGNGTRPMVPPDDPRHPHHTRTTDAAA